MSMPMNFCVSSRELSLRSKIEGNPVRQDIAPDNGTRARGEFLSALCGKSTCLYCFYS